MADVKPGLAKNRNLWEEMEWNSGKKISRTSQMVHSRLGEDTWNRPSSETRYLASAAAAPAPPQAPGCAARSAVPGSPRPHGPRRSDEAMAQNCGIPFWDRCTTHFKLPISVVGLGCSLGARSSPSQLHSLSPRNWGHPTRLHPYWEGTSAIYFSQNSFRFPHGVPGASACKRWE